MTDLISWILEFLKHFLSLLHHQSHVSNKFSKIIIWWWWLKIIGIRRIVGEWRQIVRSWILNSLSSEYCDSRRVYTQPFIPSASPTIIMNENLIFSYFYNLCLQPLIYSILDIYPLPNFKMSILKIKCRDFKHLSILSIRLSTLFISILIINPWI